MNLLIGILTIIALAVGLVNVMRAVRASQQSHYYFLTKDDLHRMEEIAELETWYSMPASKDAHD